MLANRISNAVGQYRSRRVVEETEQRLSELAGRTDDVLFMIDGDWSELLFINAAYEDITGESVEDLRADPTSFLDFVHPEDTENVERALDQLARGDRSQLEYRIIRPDGQQRWVRTDSKPILDSEGEVTRIVGQVRDITEQKQRERQLETVIENLPGYVYRHEYTQEHPLSFVEGDAAGVTGYTAAELEEEVELAEELIHPDDRADVWSACVEGVEDAGRYDVTYRIVTKDGKQQWIRDQGQLVDDPVTGQECLDGFITDVTEHKERQQELERTSEFFREAERLGDLGAWEFDPSGSVFWTDGTRRVYEVDDEFEPTLENAIDFFNPEEREEIRRLVRRASEAGESYDREFRITTAEGNERWVRARANPVEGDPPRTVRGYVQDITERKEREQALVTQNDRLEQFTNAISHDLRSPMNVAQMRLDLLDRECESDHIAPLKRAHSRMEALLEDMMEVAKEGAASTEKEQVAVGDVTAQCWQNVETAAATLEVDGETHLQADEGRLKQLFENLFQNAVDHGGDEVTVTVGTLADGFYVEDDGPGIPPDERSAVFEAGNSTAEDGTGFGLTIVDEVVRAHDWEIQVIEGTAGGARFEVTTDAAEP